MAAVNLKNLDVDGLLKLRGDVEDQLAQRRTMLEKQLASLGDGKPTRKHQGALKGTKVAPKYRSKKEPKLTWAGRGATPIWMRDEMKAGKLKKEAFLIKE